MVYTKASNADANIDFAGERPLNEILLRLPSAFRANAKLELYYAPEKYRSSGPGSPEPQWETLRLVFFLSLASTCANLDFSRIVGPFQ